MKKLFGILLVAMMTTALAFAAAADEESHKLGFSLSNQNGERWVIEEQLFEEFCEEHGWEFTCLIADDDAEKQYSQCESMISNGVEAICVRPVDSASAGVIAEMCEDAGVLYIAYDVLALNGPVDYYITFDCELVGEYQAQSLLDVVPTGNYAVINGNPSSNNCQLYYKGVMNILQPAVDAGDIKIVTDQWCPGFNTDTAAQHLENALTANNNDIQAVYSCTDTMSTALVAVLEGQDLVGKVAICGQDAEIPACQRIVEGTQTSTIYKRVKQLNAAALAIIYAALTGGDVEAAPTEGTWDEFDNGYKKVPTFKVDIVKVTKDNIVDTVVADNYHTIEEIYANVPEEEWPEQ